MTPLQRYLADGKGPDSLQFDPNFGSALNSLFSAAPPEIQQYLRINSGYRSNDRQAQLYQQALAKYGSEAAARKWVAPPGRSRHNHGHAADLGYLSPQAKTWVHQNASRFGLAFPMAHEPWHIELAGARGQQSSPGAALTTGPSSPAPQPNAAPSSPLFAPPAPFPGETTIAGMFAPRQQDFETAQAEKLRKQALFDTALM